MEDWWLHNIIQNERGEWLQFIPGIIFGAIIFLAGGLIKNDWSHGLMGALLVMAVWNITAGLMNSIMGKR